MQMIAQSGTPDAQFKQRKQKMRKSNVFNIAVTVIGMLCADQVNADQELKLWYDQPAEQWVEALPIGNGSFGAMVFGGTAKERIQFNDDTLFTGEPHDYAHKGAVKHLPELRRLLFEGKQKEAHSLGNKEFMSVNTHGKNRQEAYQPFGTVNLSFPGHETISEYYRDLDLTEAMVTTRYKLGDVTYTREVFASFPDKAIVMQVQADKKGALSFNAALSCQHTGAAIKVEGDTIILSGQIEGGKTRFEARLKVMLVGGKLEATDKGITVSNADRATLVLVGASSYVNYQDVSGNPAGISKKRMKNASAKTYPELRKEHVEDYQALFKRCTLDLGTTDKVSMPTDKRLKPFGPDDPQLAALFFQYGRYLMISCSRPGAQPSNLQGLWNDQKRPAWDSKYTININTEMNYWPAELTGLSECHVPLFDALKELSVSGQNVAKEHYGARGWVLHHNFDIWRGAAPINNANHGIWVTGGAWLCQHLWWGYAFTGDKNFLEKDAYPIMKEAALFFLDYLVEDPKGKEKFLISGPSNSPEQGGLVMGPTMDHQIIRTLLKNTAEAARILDVDKDLQKQWTETAKRIAPNQIGTQGQLKEWFYTESPKTKHRHVSHLWDLHPGLEIHPRRTPELAEACRTTLKFRGDGGTGWSKAWKINFWARLLDGDHSYKMLAEALRGNTYPNLFDAHPPFQIDGNFGATSGIAEMLLQSNGKEIEILPALPAAFQSGKVTGLRARGGFAVDIEWKNGKLISVAIHSLTGTDCSIRYKEKIRQLHLNQGQTIQLDGKDF